jgi:hypothetical protein
MILKKISVVLIGLMFLLSLAVTTSYAQRAVYWGSGNGGLVVSYGRVRPRRVRYVRTYRPRYYTYPTYVRYRTYPRYYTTYYPDYSATEYVEYPQYRTYRRYPRSGVVVNLRW